VFRHERTDHPMSPALGGPERPRRGFLSDRGRDAHRQRIPDRKTPNAPPPCARAMAWTAQTPGRQAHPSNRRLPVHTRSTSVVHVAATYLAAVLSELPCASATGSRRTRRRTNAAASPVGSGNSGCQSSHTPDRPRKECRGADGRRRAPISRYFTGVDAAQPCIANCRPQATRLERVSKSLSSSSCS
jgi:hypothetical protein